MRSPRSGMVPRPRSPSWRRSACWGCATYPSSFSRLWSSSRRSLSLSYRQTAAAYLHGGGAYIVATDNLGIHAGVWAAVALLLDYLLNVAVGIAAGGGAGGLALPILPPHTL